MQIDARAMAFRVIQAPSLRALAGVLVSGIAQSRSVALTRVWVGEALELAASAGTPKGGGSYSHTDAEFREIAVTHAKIREIAARREPFLVRSLRGDEEWVIDSWAARQGVRAFHAFPLLDADSVVGVLAIFDREMPDDCLIGDLQFVADIAAARVAELRARDETPRAPAVLTRADLRRREKQNIEAALAHTRGRVFGAAGAAALLGMKPTTLASRIKALGVRQAVRAAEQPARDVTVDRQKTNDSP